MRYAQVIPFDVCNGIGIGTSLFVQGCDINCFGCFNQSTWSFDGGKEWDNDIKEKFFDIIAKYYIKRVSILGGEPLARENANGVLSIVQEIKENFPNKRLWLYSGYKFETIMNPAILDVFSPERDAYLETRKEIVKTCDILVDGRYVDELRDITLPFYGSSNQRIIDIAKTLEKNEIVLYNK